MMVLGVGLFRQIAGLHRHAESILAHGGPVEVARRSRRRGARPARPTRRFGSAFCLMRPRPATGRRVPRR
ncbi:hypothetical protein [Burkholderia pseudomallei]|uniref:hypothetical protein n=1 Tax=Burkholderia pseudomallei TaxID=28450 RepID=UPI0009774113|nr:hypothetical protein [Burkholderia pseudomallei]